MRSQHSNQGFAHQTNYSPRQEDPYQERMKVNEPVNCPDCGAVYHQGRWRWGARAANSEDHCCPACSRIRDNIPAGFLTISGKFFLDNKDEILSLVRNHEHKEKTQRPLERIMDIEESPLGVTIRFTGIHITRSSGEAINSAYKGNLKIDHNERSGQTRVTWLRD